MNINSVIVTGANGFVGSATIRKLLKNNIKVYALDLPECNNNIPDNKNLIFIPFDMNKSEELTQMISEKNIDAFYHFAWAGSSGLQRADYDLQLLNVKYTCNAIKLASELNCKKFIGVGTIAQFDCQEYISEDGSTPNNVSCYGSAKIAAHYMSKALSNKLKVEHIWAILPNIYGEGNRTENFINFATKILLTGERAAFTSGEQPYDFVYISDIANALYLLGEKGISNYSYYIGSNTKHKLREYIVMLRDCINPKIELHLGEIPFNGKYLPESVFDCSKLIAHTGYDPKISFQDGIKKTIEWLKDSI